MNRLAFAPLLLLIVATCGLCISLMKPRTVNPIPPEPASEQLESIPSVIVYDAPRSSKWPAVREEWIIEHPECAACGSREMLNVHHIKPFHLHPELELDRGNLITLCREHHYRIGHDKDGLGTKYKPNWSDFNPMVVEDCREYRGR